MENNYNHMTQLNNRLASFLLFLCAVAVLGVLMVLVWRHNSQSRLPENIVVEIKVDSLSELSALDMKTCVDSLNEIMQRRETLLVNRYQHLLDEKEADNNLLSYGSIFIGVIFSVLGFFGFKSFQSIEDKAKLIAEDTAKSAVNNFTKTELKGEISDLFEINYLSKVKDTIKAEILDGPIADLKKDMTYSADMRDDLDRLEDSVDVLNKRVDCIEQGKSPSTKDIHSKVENTDKNTQTILPQNPFEDNPEGGDV